MKISIITINYNNKTGLQKTMESVLSQSYSDIEYIVIDGNSSDGGKELLDSYKRNLAFCLSEPDTGIYNAMNKGVEHATGEYIMYLNSGDVLIDNDVITRIVPRLGEADIVCGQLISMISREQFGRTSKKPLTMLDFVKGGPIPHPATFTRKTVFERLRFDESLRIVSDWKFFLQAIMFEGFTHQVIDEVITVFEEGGISSDPNRCEPERRKVIDEFLPASIKADYNSFLYGNGYEDDDYDRFFKILKKYQYGKITYTLAVSLVRALSLVRPSARFAKRFPLSYRKN